MKDKYELRAARIFRKHIKRQALTIPFDKLTPNTYKAYVNFYIEEQAIKDAYLETYIRVGMAHGRRVGNSLNSEINKKNFSLSSFEPALVQFIQNWLLSNGGLRITSVKQSVAEYIIEFIAKSLEQSTDIRTIARELEKHIRSRGFYRWQIERIVRTETTAAANMGATIAGRDSGLVLEKEWISSHDGRTRRRPDDLFDHWEMDGVRVDDGEPFNVNGDLIQFPGDPEGHPANVINCRCGVVKIGKRDANGRLIFRDRSKPSPALFV